MGQLIWGGTGQSIPLTHGMECDVQHAHDLKGLKPLIEVIGAHDPKHTGTQEQCDGAPCVCTAT